MSRFGVAVWFGAFVIGFMMLAGCERGDTTLQDDMRECRVELERLNKELSAQEQSGDQLGAENAKLREEKRRLKQNKEIGEVTILDSKCEMFDRDSIIRFSGTMKNTGLAYLQHCTLKIIIADQYKNVLTIGILRRDDIKKQQAEFFFPVADSLDKEEEKGFQIDIPFVYWDANSLSRVKEATDKNQYEIVPLFVSAR